MLEGLPRHSDVIGCRRRRLDGADAEVAELVAEWPDELHLLGNAAGRRRHPRKLLAQPLRVVEVGQEPWTDGFAQAGTEASHLFGDRVSRLFPAGDKAVVVGLPSSLEIRFVVLAIRPGGDDLIPINLANPHAVGVGLSLPDRFRLKTQTFEQATRDAGALLRRE
ncbi:hypothetical protein D3C71_1158140 [compost metagenome]